MQRNLNIKTLTCNYTNKDISLDINGSNIKNNLINNDNKNVLYSGMTGKFIKLNKKIPRSTLDLRGKNQKNLYN